MTREGPSEPFCDTTKAIQHAIVITVVKIASILKWHARSFRADAEGVLKAAQTCFLGLISATCGYLESRLVAFSARNDARSESVLKARSMCTTK